MVSARWGRSGTSVVLAILALTGCTQTISMQPAPDSNNPLCADVMVRLPDSIQNVSRTDTAAVGEGFQPVLERVWTDAQATAAWGENGVVTLVCGVPEPGPVALPCSSSGGIDWLVDSSDPARTRMITYGREPATQVEFDRTQAFGAAIWDAIAMPLQAIPAHKTCETASE